MAKRNSKKRKRNTLESSSVSGPASAKSNSTRSSVSSKKRGTNPRTRSRSRDRSTRPTNSEDTSPREGVLQQSLVNFQSYIESIITALESNITHVTTVKVTKRLKYTTRDFNFKGNKEQFLFNSKLIDSLQDCLDLTDSESRMKASSLRSHRLSAEKALAAKHRPYGPPAFQSTARQFQPAPNINHFQGPFAIRPDRGSCCSCRQPGHWKSSCPVLLTATRQQFRPCIHSLVSYNQQQKGTTSGPATTQQQ